MTTSAPNTSRNPVAAHATPDRPVDLTNQGTGAHAHLMRRSIGGANSFHR
jgi:hypothetical protein